MRRIACIRWNENDCQWRTECGRSPAIDRQSLVAYCGRFSPIVGVEPTDPASILLDITGLAHLFGGETALGASIVRGFQRLGLRIRLAIADTLGASLAIAKTKGKGREQNAVCIVPPGETLPHLARLPIETLRLPTDTVRLLHDLGIRRIGQVEGLPRADLLSRFGPVLLMRLDQALGRLDEPVPACSVPPTFAADWSGEYPTSRRETIEAVLSQLVDRLSGLLAHGDRGVLQLECRLDCQPGTIDDDGSAPAIGRRDRGVRMSLGLFRPTADAGHLFQLLALQLERLRIPSPVDGVHLEALLTARLEPRRQTTLFEPGDIREANSTDRRRSFTMLVERLSSRLGCEAVVRVRLRPEAQPELAWHERPVVEHRRRRPSQKTLPPELPPRPLRLLQRPVLLQRDAVAATTQSFTPEPPPWFCVGGERHRVARSWGPERIETGWWRGQAVGRDYFHVETTAGRHFWIFRRLRDEQWLLHGVFE